MPHLYKRTIVDFVRPDKRRNGESSECGVALHRPVREDGTMQPSRSLRIRAIVLLSMILAMAACATAPIPTTTPAIASPEASIPAVPTPAVPSVTIESAAPGASSAAFPFAADAIVGYYESQGYVCTLPAPSTEAVGYAYRTCQLTDGDGRSCIVGVVTDGDGALADGFASLEGTDSEPILDPVVALDPFAGFLGAMLGEGQGEALLPWLAGHLGDTYATTTVGELTVATYTEAADDHSKLYIEVANQAYLDAPRPSSAP